MTHVTHHVNRGIVNISRTILGTVETMKLDDNGLDSILRGIDKLETLVFL